MRSLLLLLPAVLFTLACGPSRGGSGDDDDSDETPDGVFYWRQGVDYETGAEDAYSTGVIVIPHEASPLGCDDMLYPVVQTQESVFFRDDNYYSEGYLYKGDLVSWEGNYFWDIHEEYDYPECDFEDPEHLNCGYLNGARDHDGEPLPSYHRPGEGEPTLTISSYSDATVVGQALYYTAKDYPWEEPSEDFVLENCGVWVLDGN